jgi:hypothetical protein
MKQCPITYEAHTDAGLYSKKGLRYISSGLDNLEPVDESVFKKIKNKRGQVVYPALLSPTNNRFIPSEGKIPSYFLFGAAQNYPSLPENMDASLRVIALFDLPTPLHGLVQTVQGTWLLFVKNPAAYSKNRFYPVQSMRILADIGHEPVIDLEKVASVISSHTSFPMLEKITLLKLAIALYLIGDTSFGPDQLAILDERGRKTLEPFGDVANMSMYGEDAEMHLRLDGKTRNFTMDDLISTFGKRTLQIPDKAIQQITTKFKGSIRKVFSLIEKCYLPDELKEEYLLTLDNRWMELGL